VSPEAIRYLTRYLDADGVPGPDEPLWRTRRGETRAVTYWAMRRVLQRANEKLGRSQRIIATLLKRCGGVAVIVRDAGKESTHSFPLPTYSAPGGLRQDPGRAAESPTKARTCGNGSREMRVLLSTYGSRGDVEPLVGLAVRLRALGAEVRVCAPPDAEFAERPAGVGVPLVPVGQPVRAMVTGATPPSAADLPRRAAALVAAQFDTVAAATEGCDALVAGGVMPVAERSVTEKLGIRSVYASYQPITLPSPHRPPLPRPGRPFPPEVTDNRALWEDNVRDHIYTDHP